MQQVNDGTLFEYEDQCRDYEISQMDGLFEGKLIFLDTNKNKLCLSQNAELDKVYYVWVKDEETLKAWKKFDNDMCINAYKIHDLSVGWNIYTEELTPSYYRVDWYPLEELLDKGFKLLTELQGAV